MVKKILLLLVIIIALLIAVPLLFDIPVTIGHSKPTSPPEAIVETDDPLLNSIRKTENFLKTYQETNGYFSKGLLAPRPAFTCLVIEAFLSSPSNLDENTPFIKKSIDAILSCKNDDGGFYDAKWMNMTNYCTNLAIMVLHKANPEKYKDVVLNATKFVKSSQLVGQDYGGGFGYAQGADKADMSNTIVSLESLNLAGQLDEKTIENALKFIESCQNNSETNKALWASNDGGFIYRPANSKAGDYDDNGVKRFKSYGLMTYAGLLSLIFANLEKDDPRVKAAMGWISKNFDLNSNVELGARGLYYYYVTMAKALDAYGQEKIITDDGIIHYWAKELAEKILSLQRPDGSFMNTESKEWLENDQILVSTYMLKALSICYKNIKKNQPTNTEN